MRGWKVCRRRDLIDKSFPAPPAARQRIAVFQQCNSGQAKIQGIRRFAAERIRLEIFDIDAPLPPLLEDSEAYLPAAWRADLVLDFLRHPDLSYDLGCRCRSLKIPMVASGKKWRLEGISTPPT